MSVVTTRPSATQVLNDDLIGGAGSLHATLNDDSDSTYVQIAEDALSTGPQIRFSAPTIPAGAIFKEWRVRIRTRKIGGTRKLSYSWNDLEYKGSLQVSWNDWVTHTMPFGASTLPLASSHYDLALASPGSNEKIEWAEAYFDAVYISQPALSVDSPSGTLNDSSAPLVSWTPVLDADGGFQFAYTVKIFSADQYGAGGFDPATSTPTASAGAFSADSSYQLTDPLVDGVYRAYVRIAQLVNGASFFSDWEYSAFTIATERPAAPSIVATAQPEEARVQLDVETTLEDISADYVEIERSIDEGETWTEIRRRSSDQEADANFFVIEDDIVRAWDYEVPMGVAALYRARTVHDFEPGYSRSEWSDDDSALWDSNTWWLKGADGTRLIVRPFSLPRLTRNARTGISQPLGRSSAIGVSDKRGPWSGEITFETDNAEEQATLDAMLETTGALLLQAPTYHHWTDRWLLFGEQSRRWAVDKLAIEDTFEDLPFTVVERPTVGTVADAPTVPADEYVYPEEIVFL